MVSGGTPSAAPRVMQRLVAHYRRFKMSTYRKEWDCCGSVTETVSWEPETCPFCTDEVAPFCQDSKRLEFLYDGTTTGSDALVLAELRLLKGETLTLAEARSAIDEAMRAPLVPAVGDA